MSKPTLNMTHGAIGEAMCCYTDGSYKDADIALAEYENSIRADERRKFAEWLSENKKVINPSKGYMRSDEILAEYEKGQKNEQG